MAYTGTYVAGDLKTIAIDIAGIFLAAMAGEMGTFAQMTALLLVIGVIGALITAILAIPLLFVRFARRRNQ